MYQLILTGPTIVDANGWRAWFYDDLSRAAFTLRPGCVMGTVDAVPPGFEVVVLHGETEIISHGHPCSVHMAATPIAGHADARTLRPDDVQNLISARQFDVKVLAEVIRGAIAASVASYGMASGFTDRELDAMHTAQFLDHAAGNAAQQVLFLLHERKESPDATHATH